MKKFSFVIGLVMLTIPVFAQQPIVVELWPMGAPHSNGLYGPETQFEGGRVGNVTVPTLTVYPAKKGNGMAIVTCPGGGYVRLAMRHEGFDMADWFNNQGITYAVLKYRMPNGHPEVPLEDAQQAIKLMRKHAKEWNLDPAKVGIMGNSAGGHLASTVATHFTSDEDHPNFQILFYAVMGMNSGSGDALFGKQSSPEIRKKYVSDTQVTAKTPPAFIACSADDPVVSPDNSIRYFQALNANKVPATLHIYPTGGHGWGYYESFLYKREWTAELEKWLRELYR